MASMVYGLMNTIGQSSMFPFVRPGRPNIRRRDRRTGGLSIEADADFSVLDQLQDWAHQFLAEQDVELSSLPSAIRTMVQARMDEVFSGLNESLNDELSNSHGIVSDLIRRNSVDRILRVKLNSSEPSLSIEFDMNRDDAGLSVCEHSCDISAAKLSTRYLRYALRRSRVDPVESHSNNIRRAVLAELIEDIVSSAYATLAQPFPANSYYLPAARSGITQGHKVIASTMVRQSNFAGLQRMDIPTLPGVVTDFMSHMLTIETAPGQLRTEGSRRPSKLDDVIGFLERQVVKGLH